MALGEAVALSRTGQVHSFLESADRCDWPIRSLFFHKGTEFCLVPYVLLSHRGLLGIRRNFNILDA